MDIVVPGYDNLTRIGRGGFSVVYRARHIALGREDAVKVVRATDLGDQAQRDFQRECAAIGGLTWHPNVVTVHASGVTAAGEPYLAMEYLPEGSLADHLRAHGPLPWHGALAVAIAVAGALEAAHAAGLVHRDVKPANLLIGPAGEPKLADFGIARLEDSTREPSSTGITASLAYAAPEVLDGRPARRTADVYSLGATLFALLAGAPAFVGAGHPAGIAAAVARIASLPVPDLRPRGVPGSLCEALERAMAKRPEERWPSARAFGEGLQEVQAGLGEPVTPLVVEPADLRHQALGSQATLSLAASPTRRVKPDRDAPGPTRRAGAHRRAGIPAARVARRPVLLGLAGVVAIGALLGLVTLLLPGEGDASDPGPDAAPGEAGTFTIALGDRIAAGEPGAGAGRIAEPGGRDTYRFEVSGGEEVFFEVQSACVDGGGLRYTLTDPQDRQVFAASLDRCGPVRDQGPFLLEQPGSYTLTVTAEEQATGDYALQVHQTTRQRFPLTIGDPVAPGVPAEGAGAIAAPGDTDVYVLQAGGGERVFVEVQSDCRQDGGLRYALAAPDGTEVDAGRIDACTRPPGEAVVLEAPGEYTLTVSGDGAATGDYALQVWDAPVRRVDLRVGDRLAPGTPSGAVPIDTPGTRMEATLTAEGGEEVFFDVQSACVDGGDLRYALTDPDGVEVFEAALDACLVGGDRGPVVLERPGDHTLTIFGRGAATGDYALQVTAVPEPGVFPIAVGSRVEPDVPTQGAGRIDVPLAVGTYPFTAPAGREILFDHRRACDPGSGLRWTLRDPQGEEVFRRRMDGCGTNPTVTIERSGRYVLEVFGDPPDFTGTYVFEVTDVTDGA